MEDKNHSKKGQVTIFIIIGLMIFLAFLLFFLLPREKKEPVIQIKNPRSFIKSCVIEVVRPRIEIVLRNGGRINPSQYIMYNGSKYNYLCYSEDYYASCINTHPFLEQIVEGELYESTREDVAKCFDLLKKEYTGRGYSLNFNYVDYSLDIIPGAIEFKIKSDVDYSFRDSSGSISDFSFSELSSLYELIRVSREIVNSEAQFCNVEYIGYMILYPKFNIERTDYYGSKIYKVSERSSGEEFRFAIRSCAFPPGI